MTEFSHMCCGECGIEFRVPQHFYEERRKTGKGWHCPNGHSRVFRESDVDRFRRERDQARQDLARVKDECEEQRRRAERAEAATKKLKKRTSAGTCPCCSRTFQNMATHMKRQHPEFVTEGGAKIVQLKTIKA